VYVGCVHDEPPSKEKYTRRSDAARERTRDADRGRLRARPSSILVVRARRDDRRMCGVDRDARLVLTVVSGSARLGCRS